MNAKNNLNPTVDIIIPNYNKGLFIEECIESVLNQTYKDWQLYIIDDASNDNSRKILDKYFNKANINITYLNKNKGPYFCRNLGIRKSKSDLISFLDSDDYWTKNKLKDQISFMIDKNYDFTYSDYFFFFKNDKQNLKETRVQKKFLFKDFIKDSSINSSTMILKRNIVGLTKFKKVKHEDYLFKCDILKKNLAAFKIDKKLAYYRIIDSSRSSSKLSNLISLWYINKRFNNLNIFENFKSLFFISLNSLKKYGIK